VKYVFGVERLKRPEFEKKYLHKPDSDYVVLEENDKEIILTNPRTKEYFEEFRKLHHDILGSMDYVGVKRLLLFLDAWNPEEFLQNPKIAQYKDEILAGGNIVFDDNDSFLHENSGVKALWEKYHSSQASGDDTVFSQCLVTGETEPIARTHQKIKGVFGAQQAGASIVGFNDDAFVSYNKKQSYNAPVSEISMFKYTTALNYLLTQKANRLRIADTTTVFWAETDDKTCENLAPFFINPPSRKKDSDGDANEPERVRDTATLQLIEDVLTRVRNGQTVRKEDLGTDPDVNFYILGLSPNNARIAIRYWYKDTFGNFVDTVAQHHLDMDIVPEYSGESFGPEFISVYWLLRETVPKSSDKNDVSPILGGLIMRAILNETPYPIQMYSAILNRVKVEKTMNTVRAGFIKAYLLRQSRAGLTNIPEELITVKLNEESVNVPYRLGRLFAVLEKVQNDTNKDIGATINSKYFSSASSTPAVVFPVLLKLAQHHISKSDWGFKTNQSIEEILSEVNEFPEYMNLDEQGMFMLGYYHQRKANYQKKSESSVEEEKL
jgi:CRISPR-associated protein Csd1